MSSFDITDGSSLPRKNLQGSWPKSPKPSPTSSGPSGSTISLDQDTGADYYVAPVGASPDDLEDCVRLEISGVDRGGASAVAQRLKAKLEQVAAGKSNLPAMAGVVGFQARIILLSRLENS